LRRETCLEVSRCNQDPKHSDMCSRIASFAIVTDLRELVPCSERRRAEGGGTAGGRSTAGEKERQREGTQQGEEDGWHEDSK